MRPFSLPAVSTSIGRWLHTAMQESNNPVRVYRIKHFPSRARPKTTPGTTLPGLCSFGNLAVVSTESGVPALGQHSAMNLQQHPQAPVAMGLPGANQHSTMEGTFYSRAGLATLPAMGPLPYGSQTATSVPIKWHLNKAACCIYVAVFFFNFFNFYSVLQC